MNLTAIINRLYIAYFELRKYDGGEGEALLSQINRLEELRDLVEPEDD